jgi:hypothetical protein
MQWSSPTQAPPLMPGEDVEHIQELAGTDIQENRTRDKKNARFKSHQNRTFQYIIRARHENENTFKIEVLWCVRFEEELDVSHSWITMSRLIVEEVLVHQHFSVLEKEN